MGSGLGAQLAREKRVDGLVAADHAVLVGAHLTAPEPRGAREHDGERRLDLARVKRADIIELARGALLRAAPSPWPWDRKQGVDSTCGISMCVHFTVPPGACT